MSTYAPILIPRDQWQPVMAPHDLIPRTPIRSWFMWKLAGLMNLVSDCIVDDDLTGPITWRDELRWKIEGFLSWLYGLFWDNSFDELEIVVEGGMPLKYLNQRQLEFYNALCEFDLGAQPVRILSLKPEPLFCCSMCGWQGLERDLDRDNGILLGGLFSGIKSCPECDALESYLEELP